jgi:hypothetical protein
MRKHVLFFVHGMGSYVTKSGTANHAWAKAAANSLKEQYKKYRLLKGIPFEERFDVIHINYDTKFHEILKRWEEESQTILAAGGAGAAEMDKLLGWLQGGSQLDDNYSWTHVVDVILYKFSLVRQAVKAHVANQFRSALAPNANGAVTSWSVISHSLGTIVTHDVLHALDSTSVNQAGISILDSMVPSANVVAMVANVTKVMESDIDVYDSLVVPSSAVKMQSACFNYLSFNNKLDPFVQPRPFAPTGRPAWDVARANETYLDVETRNVHELNVHSFSNYIVNPAVHIPLLERLCGIGSILPKEKTKAFDEFDDVPDETVKTALEQLKTQFEDNEWIDLIGNLYARWSANND